MERTILTGVQARDKVIEGANKVAIASTLGPFGLNGLIEKGLRVTNDGLKLASEITLEDEIEDLGARKIKEAMAKANDQAGDGSTTTAVVAQAILAAGAKLLSKESVAGKITTSDFIRKIKREKDEVVGKLNEHATKITTEEELIRSAVVSVEDEELGELIGRAQWELGPDGFLIAEEVPEKECSAEKISGIRIDNGLGASFVMNNQEKQMLEDENVRTILTNATIQNLLPLQKLLEQMKKNDITKVAIIARGFSNEAIQICGQNIQNGYFIYPINAPFTDQKEVMLDLASVLGGQFMDTEVHALEDMQLSDVGFATKIRARRYDAIFTGQESNKVEARIEVLKEQLKGSQSDFQTRMLQSRIAQLENGFGLIKIGAESDTERKRLFDKAEDAVGAVRAALQEGTVPGAGLEFKTISEGLPDDYILKRPLMSIYENIMANAPKDFIVEDWVRDPVKVLRIALEQACSVAGDLSTISLAVATKKVKYNALIKND